MKVGITNGFEFNQIEKKVVYEIIQRAGGSFQRIELTTMDLYNLRKSIQLVFETMDQEQEDE